MDECDFDRFSFEPVRTRGGADVVHVDIAPNDGGDWTKLSASEVERLHEWLGEWLDKWRARA